MGRYADNVTQILMEQGRQQGAAQLARGQAWGQAAQQLGQIPGQVLQQRQQQAEQDQQREVRAQALRTAKAAEAQHQQDTADAVALSARGKALSTYFAELGEAEPDPKRVLAIAGPDKGLPILNGFVAMRRLQRDEYQDGQKEVQDVVLGLNALAEPDRAAAWPGTRATFIAKGFMQPADAPEAYDASWWKAQVNKGVQAPAAGTREIKVRNVDGSESISIVKDEPTTTPFTSAPPVEKPPAVGSFEDYVVRKFGPTPTDAQIEEARKRYQQADDRPIMVHTGAAAARTDRRTDTKARAWEALPLVKRTVTMSEAVGFADKLDPKTTNPADDQALIYAFAKAMDPDSVVREGEYATVQKYAQSWASSFGFNAARIFSNTTFLTPDARKNMKATIQTKFSAAKEQYDGARNSYVKQINQITGGTDGADFLTDFSTAFPKAADAGASRGQIVVKDPNGTAHPFATQAEADAFKKLAGIR